MLWLLSHCSALETPHSSDNSHQGLLSWRPAQLRHRKAELGQQRSPVHKEGKPEEEAASGATGPLLGRAQQKLVLQEGESPQSAGAPRPVFSSSSSPILFLLLSVAFLQYYVETIKNLYVFILYVPL